MKELFRLEGAVSLRVRRVALLLVLVSQTAMFLVMLPRPIRVISDNVRYENAGWLLATGHGLSLPDEIAADPDVHRWVCVRHPSACVGGIAPTAMYPPGYQVFVAGIYRIVGRSVVALAFANLALLLTLFMVTERLASRLLPPGGYAFVVLVSIIYPFLAAQATVLMSDQLHATLLLAALGALFLIRPGVARGAAFGLLLAAATLTRPYGFFVVPTLLVWRPLHRALRMSRNEWLVATTLCAAPFVLWIVRNAYWFGRLIPFSTTAIGASLYNTVFEMQGGNVYDPEGSAYFWRTLSADGDPTSYKVNHSFLVLATKTIAGHPFSFAAQVLKHAPKLWVSLGGDGAGWSPAWPLLVGFLGVLAALGFIGMWLTRREASWHAFTITVLVYWSSLLPLAAEARRTLPLRMPMLLLGAVTATAIARWWNERGRAVLLERVPQGPRLDPRTAADLGSGRDPALE